MGKVKGGTGFDMGVNGGVRVVPAVTLLEERASQFKGVLLLIDNLRNKDANEAYISTETMTPHVGMRPPGLLSVVFHKKNVKS